MSAKSYLGGKVVVHGGDCLDVLRGMESCSVDSVVTDPPYALVSIGKRFGADGAAPPKDYGGSGVYKRASAGFMGKQWDTGDRAFSVEFWREVFRVLKPGGHVLAFGGTRTVHRLACAIEDAGFEIRDQIMWVFGSGFPKSHDVSKGIDKAAGAERPIVSTYKRGLAMHPGNEGVDKWRENHTGEVAVTAPATAAAREWQGWGTALKPAVEPIVLARKPLSEGTVAANCVKHGTGAINVGACRVATDDNLNGGTYSSGGNKNALPGDDRSAAGQRMFAEGGGRLPGGFKQPPGRWPANLIHDGSDEVVAAFPLTSSGSIALHHKRITTKTANTYGERAAPPEQTFGDTGSAARFFYSSKADADDRLGSKHPTIKPVDLIQYLVRLITPPNGVCLDPFAGTGTTGEAAFREGMRAVLIEREPEYIADIERRMQLVLAGPDERKHATIKARGKTEHAGPLFALPEAAE